MQRSGHRDRWVDRNAFINNGIMLKTLFLNKMFHLFLPEFYTMKKAYVKLKKWLNLISIS